MHAPPQHSDSKCLLGVEFDPATHCLHRSTSAKPLSHFGTVSTTFLPMRDGYGSDIFLYLDCCTAAFRTKCKPWVSNDVLAVPAAYAGIMDSLEEKELLGKLHQKPRQVTDPLLHAPETKREAVASSLGVAMKDTNNSDSKQANNSDSKQDQANADPSESIDPVLKVGNRVILDKQSTQTKATIFGATHKTNVDGTAGTESLPGGHNVTLFPNSNFEVVMVNETSVSLKPVASFWQTIASVAKTTKTTGDADVVAQISSFAEAYNSGAHCFATGAHCLQHSCTPHSPKLETPTTQRSLQAPHPPPALSWMCWLQP